MKKIELLNHINELSSFLSSDARNYISFESISEMHMALDKMTEEYLNEYCAA